MTDPGKGRRSSVAHTQSFVIALAALALVLLALGTFLGDGLGGTLRGAGIVCLLSAPWLWVAVSLLSTLRHRRSRWFARAAGLVGLLILAGLALF